MEEKGIVWEHDLGFHLLLDLLLDSWLVGARPFEEIFIVDESFDVFIAVIDERNDSLEDQCLVILEEDKRSHLLEQVLVGIQREWIRIVLLLPDLQLLEAYLHLSELALGLLTYVI